LAKRTAEKAPGHLKVFIEVNLTDREDRGGIQPQNVLEFASQIAQVPTLELVGLMAVARQEVEPSVDFERVALIRESLRTEFPQADLLSMGMSGDYLTAMEFGATHLRIGTAITGHRPLQP
jgi:uncharacterized pyridoxal phosphate-containing UPF0001 family protein